ncbi:MAG: permease [Desulfocapsaceae bacterium]
MLPAAASFKKQGANKGALASFLVSTPESGVDSIAITYALLDPIMTVARPLAAFVTGITAGILENSVSWKSTAEQDPQTPVSTAIEGDKSEEHDRPLMARFLHGLRYGFKDIWADIALWFFVGLFLAGIITVYMPDSLSQMILGGGIVAMLAMLLMGMPIYICATASTPIAAAFLLKGASPGAVLVFLLVGPATNMTSLSVLIRILGKMGTIRYLIVIAVVSIMFGLGLDAVYHYLDIEAQAVISEVRETIPYWLKLGSAVILILLFLHHLLGQFRLRQLKRRKNQFIADFPAIDSSLKTKQGSQQVPVFVQSTTKPKNQKE